MFLVLFIYLSVCLFVCLFIYLHGIKRHQKQFSDPDFPPESSYFFNSCTLLVSFAAQYRDSNPRSVFKI